MNCECQTGRRLLRLQAEQLRERFTEFAELASPQRWQVNRVEVNGKAGDVVDAPIGAGAAWDTAADLINFLRTVLSEDRIADLSAAWLPGGSAEAGACQYSGCCGANGAAMTEPTPLATFAPLDASPLVRVLREKRIESWFQPVFHAGSHELWGHECLMRARDEQGRLIGPGQLLDWAHQERLIFMLDRVCRETHIANAAAALPGDTAILINFLPTAIYEPSFCLRTTRACAKRHGLDASRVIFEVVETEQVTELSHLRNILDYYRQAGFRAALDDVGSGYAGLTMLAELSPDLIKIDRDLVRQAVNSKMHRIICNALAQIAKQSGKLCLAEGIETQAEYEAMLKIGVDLVQGFYFAKPAAEPAFATDVNPVNLASVESKQTRAA